jgi:hypothetical protein
MKTRTPWRPLLRNELLVDHIPMVPWILGGAYCLGNWFLAGWAPLAMLTNLCQGDIAAFFSSFGNVCFPFLFLWLFIVLMWIGTKTVPGVVPMATYEFYFTRAIARRSFYRARMMVLGAVVLGPLVLNLFVALRSPDLVLKPGDSPALSKHGEPLDSYLRAFPGAHPKVVRPSLANQKVHELVRLEVEGLPAITTPSLANQEVHELVLPRATLVYAAWLLWGGTLGLLAMQCYCACMAKHVSRRFGSVLIFAGLPFLPAVFLLVFFHDLTTALAEANFLFFANHWAALALAVAVAIPGVEWLAERRFDELEIS